MKQVFAAALFAASANAISIYGQCGGKNWSGSGSCDSGLTCTVINDYYSQCTSGSAGGAPAAPPTTTQATTTKAAATSGTATTAAPAANTDNPFAGKKIYANPYYASEIYNIAIPSLPTSLQAKASAVADVGTFVWLDTKSKVPTMDTYLSNIRALNKAGANPPIMGAFVVYDLPNRDCAALASNGEYSVADNGLNNYYAYVDAIAAIVKNYTDVTMALIVEPDSLGNLVTNLNVPKCQTAAPAYEAGITYAMKTLNYPHVSMYLDAGHAGWLGWDANIGPAANLFAKLFKAAGSPAAVRGLATNVANYNSWNSATAPPYTQGAKLWNEKQYINAIAPLLRANGFPAHFVTDVGRNGVQPTAQQKWGDWCNIKGTGFGVRPSTDTGDVLLDSFVWIKPGGECDGTSNNTATRYDATCGLSDALQPAPEAGTWFQAYFQQLLTNANPAF